MAHPSLTVALLRVMQSSSGISQPARLSHKACRWHTQIISIRIPKTFQHAVSQIAKGMAPDPFESGAIHSGRRFPLLCYALPYAHSSVSLSVLHLRPGACAVLPHCRCFESLLFSYILKALRMNLTAIGASLRPDEFSTDPQTPAFSYSIPQNEQKTRVKTPLNPNNFNHFAYISAKQQNITMTRLHHSKQNIP